MINLQDLAKFDEGTTVDIHSLIESGRIKRSKVNVPLKVLGGGNLEKAITVKAEAFSASAKEKIEALGGKVEVI